MRRMVPVFDPVLKPLVLTTNWKFFLVVRPKLDYDRAATREPKICYGLLVKSSVEMSCEHDLSSLVAQGSPP